MVNNQMGTDRALNEVFSALADPTRRGILARLAEGEATVKELAEPFDISPPAITKHLKVLERAGMLERNVDGRVHRCHLEAGPMKEAAQWIERYRKFWEGTLDSLAAYLHTEENR